MVSPVQAEAGAVRRKLGSGQPLVETTAGKTVMPSPVALSTIDR